MDRSGRDRGHADGPARLDQAPQQEARGAPEGRPFFMSAGSAPSVLVGTGARFAEELDLHRLDVVGRLEAEDLGVERELGPERADDRVAGSRKPWSSPG